MANEGWILSHKYLSVLLLDDNQTDAALAVGELNRAGFKVAAQVVSSEQAFRKQLSLHTFDLVLADHHVAVSKGMDAIQALRTLGLDIPVIIFTRTAGEEFVAECLKKGAVDCVRKDQLQRLPIAAMQAIGEKRSRDTQRFAAGQLAGDLIHDLNNLLAVISGNAELLERGVEEDNLKRFATNIVTATKRAAGVTRQLLTFSQKLQLSVAPRRES